MDILNKFDNRAKVRASKESGYSTQAEVLFAKSVSLGENVRVEIHSAAPDYSWVKTLAAAAPIANEATPNATPPEASRVWDLKGYRGLHGYFVLDAAQTVDVQLWALDPVNDDWMLVDSVANVPSYQEFRFADGVRGRSVILRLVNIGNTITSITARCSPE